MEKPFEDRSWKNDFVFFFKHLWIILISILLGVAMALLLAVNIPSVYRAQATYYLNKSELNSAFFTINEFEFYNLLLLDIEKLIQSRKFFNEVKAVSPSDPKINKLEHEDYLENLYFEISPDSTFFDVGYDSSDTDLAMSISKRIEMILSREAAKIVRISTVENVDITTLSKEPVAPGKIMLLIIGGILGAFVGIGLVLIKFISGKTLRTHIEAEIVTGKKVLSFTKYNLKKKNIMHLLNSMHNEDYYRVWQSINNDIEQHRQKVCMILTCDSTGKNEAFAFSLAHYMGKTYDKTLYIPINPSATFSSILTYSYGHENRLIKALIHNEPVSRLIRSVSYSFDILIGTDNRIGFNDETMRQIDVLLNEVEALYDLIIISISAEERLLNKLIHRGPVILSTSGSANRDEVRHIAENFEEMNSRFLGIAYQE